MVKIEYELNDRGVEKLVAAICRQAVIDYEKGDDNKKQAIMHFFESSYFDVASCGLIDPQKILAYLNE